MNTRQQNGQEICEGLDNLRAMLGQQDDEPQYDLDRLTSPERNALERLKELAEEDDVWDFSRLDNIQLTYLRALFRKAADEIDFQYLNSPDDRRDVQIIEIISAENFDIENIDPYG